MINTLFMQFYNTFINSFNNKNNVNQFLLYIDMIVLPINIFMYHISSFRLNSPASKNIRFTESSMPKSEKAILLNSISPPTFSMILQYYYFSFS